MKKIFVLLALSLSLVACSTSDTREDRIKRQIQCSSTRSCNS